MTSLSWTGSLRKVGLGWKFLNVWLVFPGSRLKICSKPVGWDGGDRRRKFKEETVTGEGLSETGEEISVGHVSGIWLYYRIVWFIESRFTDSWESRTESQKEVAMNRKRREKKKDRRKEGGWRGERQDGPWTWSSLPVGKESTGRPLTGLKNSGEGKARWQGKFRRGRLMLETCGSAVSNMNPSTCNLPNRQTVCAQRFPNTVVKIVLHLDWQNIRVTSENMGEGHGPRRGTGKI